MGIVLVVAVVKTLRDETLTKERMKVISDTAEIPVEESGILDFAAGVEQATTEITTATDQVTTETKRFGRLAERQSRKFNNQCE